MNERKTISGWKALIEEQIQSGLSKIKFCQQKGISISGFYRHLNLLRSNQEKGQFKANSAISSNQIVPIKIKKEITNPITNDGNIRLILKNGLECILPSSLENKRLKEIIEVLISC